MEPVKDEQREGPVAGVWRPTLAAIVDSLVRREDVLAVGMEAVEPVSPVNTRSCRDAVDAYGGVMLVPLPDEAWDTSVAIWRGNYWGCLVDLWTAEEGRSDLALDVDIFEQGGEYRYRVNLVYVPSAHSLTTQLSAAMSSDERALFRQRACRVQRTASRRATPTRVGRCTLVAESSAPNHRAV